jgi:hypothetical protein
MVLNKPNILSVVRQEGFDPRQKGNSFWLACPFHQEKQPSFKISTEKNSFHCFGCGEHGDAISFVQKLHGLTFRQALSYLGMADDRPYCRDPRDVKKRELVSEFKGSCATYSDRLAWELRGLRRLVHGIKSEEDMALRAWAYDVIPVLEYQLDVLCYGSDEARYQLYKEALNGTTV